jgi:hypothetical protein
MAVKDAAIPATAKLPTTVSEVDFSGFAPGVVPGKGSEILGRFLRVERSSVGFDFGNGEEFPVIALFTAVDGHTTDREGKKLVLESGGVYALWLIHYTLYSAFVEAKPHEGELFAVKGLGEKLKRGMREGEKNSTYHNYTVVFPERPKPAPLTWDAVISQAAGPQAAS